MSTQITGANPTTAASVPSAPHVAAPLVLNPLEMIDFQRGQIRRREYIPMGRLERIDLGHDCLPNTAPDNPLIGRWTANGHPLPPALDWLNQGPMVGFSQDGQDILICTHMVHPPPQLDPNWKRKIGPLKYMKENPQIPILEKPAMLEQSLLHRCWVGPEGKWMKRRNKWVPTGEWFMPGKDGEEWMLFQPVCQLLLFLEVGCWGIINCGSDLQGRHTVLMYDRKREEGHILFGSKDLRQYVDVVRSV